MRILNEPNVKKSHEILMEISGLWIIKRVKLTTKKLILKTRTVDHNFLCFYDLRFLIYDNKDCTAETWWIYNV